MQYEQANQPLATPPLSPQSDIRRSCKWQMPFSLLKCYDRVIERNYSPITLLSWLHEACGFFKSKKWLHVESERRNTSIELQRAFLPDVMSGSSEMVEKAAVEEEMGGVGKQRGAHTSTTIFLCISRPPTTCGQTTFPLMQLEKLCRIPKSEHQNRLIRMECFD